MDNGVFNLQLALHGNQTAPHDQPAIGVKDVFPDDHIGRAGFILQGHEDHALGGAWPLSHQDHAPNAGPPPMTQGLQPPSRHRPQPLKLRPEEAAGVGL